MLIINNLDKLYRESPTFIACAGPHFHHKVSLPFEFGVPDPISSWTIIPDLNKNKADYTEFERKDIQLQEDFKHISIQLSKTEKAITKVWIKI